MKEYWEVLNTRRSVHILNLSSLFRRQKMFKLWKEIFVSKDQMEFIVGVIYSMGKDWRVAIKPFINSSERSKCFSMRAFQEDKNPSKEIKCVPLRSSQSKNSNSIELKYLGNLRRGDF